MHESSARTSTLLQPAPDVAVVPVDESTAAMLAATALGLAIAAQDDGASTLRLLANEDAAALAAARSRLCTIAELERSTIADARLMLAAAATEAGPGR